MHTTGHHQTGARDGAPGVRVTRAPTSGTRASSDATPGVRVTRGPIPGLQGAGGR